MESVDFNEQLAKEEFVKILSCALETNKDKVSTQFLCSAPH